MRPRACTQPLRPRLPELTPSHLWHVGTASGFTPYSAPQTEVSGSVRCRPSEVFNSRPRWVRKLRLYHGPKHHHMQPRTSGFAAGHWTTPSATGLSLEPRTLSPGRCLQQRDGVCAQTVASPPTWSLSQLCSLREKSLLFQSRMSCPRILFFPGHRGLRLGSSDDT